MVTFLSIALLVARSQKQLQYVSKGGWMINTMGYYLFLQKMKFLAIVQRG